MSEADVLDGEWWTWHIGLANLQKLQLGYLPRQTHRSHMQFCVLGYAKNVSLTQQLRNATHAANEAKELALHLWHTQKKESSQLYNSTNKACKCNQKWMTEYQGLKAKQNCFAVTFWVPRKVNYKLICVFTSFKYPIIVLKGLQKLVDRAQLTAFTHSQSNLQCRNHCLGSN